MEQLSGSPACKDYMAEHSLTSETLLHHFFKKYIQMIAGKGFHVDGWEEVWEFEKGNSGLFDIYDPTEWEVDLTKTKLTGYHWYNGWLDYDAPTTGYMMVTWIFKSPIISAPKF